jgi:acyl-coenzyme A thioesterase PaaI-like protein
MEIETQISRIPLIQHLSIRLDDAGVLCMPFDERIHNHLETAHAGAQFILAETVSGLFLSARFPDLADKVVPVLREANIKYKKQATSDLIAYASTMEESENKFLQQFENKGRGSIQVDVEVKDSNDVLVCTAHYNWFVALLNQ